MGLYIRKSLRVGPIRFNLSKSGIGMSAGIKGLRLGTGPRGNYVHMGRGGLYFRQSLGSPRSESIPSSRPTSLPSSAPEPTVGSMEEIESSSVLEMTDGASAELLKELNEKRKLARFVPLAILACVVGVLVLVSASAPSWVVLLAIVVGVGLIGMASLQDALRKTTVIFYNLETDVERPYGVLHDAFGELRLCGRAWHVGARGDVRDRKYHAGASAVVTRQHIALKAGEPPMVKTNIDIPLIPVGSQTLAFMPDRLLVFDKSGVGAVSYEDLRTEPSDTRFIEDETLAADATVVGKTWKYVNKKGGPDRRFKDNRELPICIYDQLAFSSVSGLNEVIQLSRQGVGSAFAAALTAMRPVPTSQERKPSNPAKEPIAQN